MNDSKGKDLISPGKSLAYIAVFLVYFFVQDVHTRYVLRSTGISSYLLLSTHGLVGVIIALLLYLKRGKSHSKAVIASLGFWPIVILGGLHVIGLGVSGALTTIKSPRAYLEVKQVTAPIFLLIFEAIHERRGKLLISHGLGTYVAMICVGIGGFLVFNGSSVSFPDFLLGLSAAVILNGKVLSVSKILTHQNGLLNSCFDLSLAICFPVLLFSAFGMILSEDQSTLYSAIDNWFVFLNLLLNSLMWIGLLVVSFATNHYAGPYSMILLYLLIQSLHGLHFGSVSLLPYLGVVSVFVGILSYFASQFKEDRKARVKIDSLA